MSNWLEITNTLIDFETMQRVGAISRAEQQYANQMAAVGAYFYRLQAGDFLQTEKLLVIR
jgi:hypothetical protein